MNPFSFGNNVKRKRSTVIDRKHRNNGVTNKTRAPERGRQRK